MVVFGEEIVETGKATDMAVARGKLLDGRIVRSDGIAVEADDVVVSGKRGEAACGERMADSGTAATGTITLDIGSCPCSLPMEDECTSTGESYTARLICFTREGLS